MKVKGGKWTIADLYTFLESQGAVPGTSMSFAGSRAIQSVPTWSITAHAVRQPGAAAEGRRQE